MPEATITINKNDIAKILARVQTQVGFIIDRTARLMVDEAKTNAPVVSGLLRDGIHAQYFNRNHAIVYSSAGYSGFVEFGTATRVAGDAPPGYTVSRAAYDIHPVNAKVLHFVAKDGRDVFVNAIYGHPGIWPHPFFMPAVDKARKYFAEELKTLEAKVKY
jgi:hypothetical protein